MLGGNPTSHAGRSRKLLHATETRDTVSRLVPVWWATCLVYLELPCDLLCIILVLSMRSNISTLPPRTEHLKCSVGGREGANIAPQLHVHVVHATEGSLKCLHLLDSNYIVHVELLNNFMYLKFRLNNVVFLFFQLMNLLCSKVLKKLW